jgi:hypothetical protein
MMYVTFLSAILLSAVSAYYSIIGLTTIFMGAFWPIVLMGVALEFAKLVAASWLYQNWRRASVLLRIYLTSAVLILVLITSMGIFGFLAKSHIDSTMDNKSNATELETLNAEEKIITSRLNYLLARAQTLSRSDDKEIASNRIEREIKDTQKQLSKLNQVKSSLLKNENELIAHIGPVFYLAELFYNDPQNSVDKSVRLVIIAIMFVFDPLAVLLFIAGNMLATDKRRRTHPEEFIDPPPPTPKPKPVKIVETPNVSITPPIDRQINQPMSAATSAESQPAESLVSKVDAATAGNTTIVKTPAAAPTTNAAPSPINPKATTKPNITEEALAAMSLQMSTKVMTDNDIAAAFKLFYDRAPTKQDDLSIYKGMSSKQILEIFYTAPEFLARPGVATLVLGAAKKMQDLKNKS